MQGHLQEDLQDSSVLSGLRHCQSVVRRYSPRACVCDSSHNVSGGARRPGGSVQKGRLSGATEGTDIPSGQRRRFRRQESRNRYRQLLEILLPRLAGAADTVCVPRLVRALRLAEKPPGAGVAASVYAAAAVSLEHFSVLHGIPKKGFHIRETKQDGR